MKDCRTCIYDPDSWNDSGCYGCVQHSNYIPKPKPTNADRIRAMSDEELAEFIGCIDVATYSEEKYVGGVHMSPNQIINWLKQEVSE